MSATSAPDPRDASERSDQPGPRDVSGARDASGRRKSSSGRDSSRPRDPSAALIFDDPLAQTSADDTDRGWGERAFGGDGGDGSSDLARFLDEKPPHHL
ncbi:hypothetical protein NKH77_32460 [Streptomyces sp. M19]